ncbi:DUF58 domain-containing protein [Stieleria varia]|uniref:DUF58 domain-containing protein n=1 Tax=Stieleria varia TaxID=2528005 RepID=A0A5C6AM91_9BACT|nr:DUF58 domain-containing protein [Stieleria varia]TWU01135.1 hypothetical protein Pla52n_45070 [Stieleria varia]
MAEDSEISLVDSPDAASSAPDLTPKRLRRWFRYRLTRLGFHFLFVALFAMVGGAIRGFNLLLVLAGLLVGVMLIQWRSSRRVIHCGDVTRRTPLEIFADRRFTLRYLVQNRSRFLPMWMVKVEDEMEDLSWPSEDSIARLASAVGFIAPQSTTIATCRCLITRRGRYRFGTPVISTTFPFSLLEARQTVERPLEVMVYPALLTLRVNWQRQLPRAQRGQNVDTSRSSGGDGTFFGIREWQNGDSPRWIHWRTTARLGEPAVRQFEQNVRRRICLLVDAMSDDPMATGASAVENAISLAATMVCEMVGRGNTVCCGVSGASPRLVASQHGVASRTEILQMLADTTVVDRHQANDALQAAVEMVARRLGNRFDLVVLSPRSINNVLATDDASQQDERKSDGTYRNSLRSLLGDWKRRHKLAWVDVTSDTWNQMVVSPDAEPVSNRSGPSRSGPSRSGPSRSDADRTSPGVVNGFGATQ